MQLNTNESA